VPAVAVKQQAQALFIKTRRKKFEDCFVCFYSNFYLIIILVKKLLNFEFIKNNGITNETVICLDISRNFSCESDYLL